MTTDRKGKIPACASAHVPEVWLINVPRKKVEVFRHPHKGIYATQFEAHPGDALAPESFPDVTIDLKTLFRV